MNCSKYQFSNGNCFYLSARCSLRKSSSKSNCMFDNERIKLFEYQYIFDTKLVSLDSPDCSSLKDHNWIVHAQLCAQIASPGVQSVLFSQLGRGTEILRSGFTIIHLVCDWLVSGTDCSFEWAVDVYLASLLQNCTTHLVVSACFFFLHSIIAYTIIYYHILK